MKEAAKILDVKARMGAFHKYRMMERLNLKNDADLIRFAIGEGMVPMERSH